jgi:hypothetical protein
VRGRVGLVLQLLDDRERDAADRDGRGSDSGDSYRIPHDVSSFTRKRCIPD